MHLSPRILDCGTIIRSQDRPDDALYQWRIQRMLLKKRELQRERVTMHLLPTTELISHGHSQLRLFSVIRPKRSAVVLRHVAFEDLGRLAPIMEQEGWNVSFCEAVTDDLTHRSIRNAELVINLGGPIGVYETDDYPFLVSELALIEYRLSRDLPTLGICLGSQLMAKALGSRVFKGPVKEIGWGTINLTEEGKASCLSALQGDDAVVLHWHGDTFDLPSAATRLASNENYENQAFALGSNALALQFHLEVDPRRLEEWFVGHAVELAVAEVSVADLRAATQRHCNGLAHRADRVFSDWLRQLSPAIAPEERTGNLEQ